MHNFQEWSTIVWLECEALESGWKSGPPMLDIKEGYLLGWSPERVAKAVMGHNGADFQIMLSAMMGNQYKKL